MIHHKSVVCEWQCCFHFLVSLTRSFPELGVGLFAHDCMWYKVVFPTELSQAQYPFFLVFSTTRHLFFYNRLTRTWNCCCIKLLVILIKARPMYRHTDIYWPIWRCYRCIVSVKFRQYILAIFVHKSVALLFCMERSETQVVYFVSDPDWLTQMLCPVPSTQSLHAYRPLCNGPDKTPYDVTFARRFWRGKQMIVCEQTRLYVLLVGCFIKLSQG